MSGFGGFSSRSLLNWDPRQLPQLTKILNWEGATGAGSGTLSVPDLLGGDPATQSSQALKPIIGTSDNGVYVGTFSSHFLSLPLSAAINDNLKFGMAFWVQLANVSGLKTFAVVQNVPGGASANKLLINTFGGRLQTRALAVDRRADIVALDTNWRFCYIGIDCSKNTEPAQVVMSLDGFFSATSFNTDTAWPPSLGTPTGNMLIGAGTLAAASPLVGRLGDIYFFSDQLNASDVGRLRRHKAPLIIPLVGNIVALGNSITEGAGASPTQNYPAVLGATLGHDWQVFNCGHSSWTTTQLLANFGEVQSHFTTQTSNNILIVNEISNEIDAGVSETVARQNMQALIAKGRASGWRVLFATTTPRSLVSFTPEEQQRSSNINDFFRNNPSERDGIIDWAAHPQLADPNDLTYYFDGVHPTAAGYAIMADMVHTVITA